MSIENIKYCIKRHIASLEHCIKRHIASLEHYVSCKLSPAYSLYSVKQFYFDDRCGRVHESASVYLISMFCSCSTFNRLS